MSKTYVVSVDSMLGIDADSEEEALQIAPYQFIDKLRRGELELIITEEFEDE